MNLYILGAFLLSLTCGAIFTPAIINYCKRKKLYDLPNERKVHKNAVPRLGGISFFPSMIVSFAVCLLIISSNDGMEHPFNIWSASYLAGLSIMYVVGTIDDLVGLNAKNKFVAQICAAAMLPMARLYINNLYGLFGIYEIPAFIGIPLTIFTIVFIVNAINLIDGIDGLAGCISVLALGGFMTYFIHYDVFRNTYTILTAGMIGALIAFLYYNLFGSPEKNTKIFMGDSGSLSLGFTLGFLAIKSTMDVEIIWPYRPEALLVPMTLLFVPSADVVRVTFFRLYHKRPLFDADKNHIHHKLMRAGMSQHQALLFILTYIIGICIFNANLYPAISVTTILLADIIIYLAVNIGINFLIKRKS
jgi:UDP-N-acetylmuramyl pentapeptide phosphotransferase/UDP-N-acetylglucosamine-1-phosphate transferase